MIADQNLWLNPPEQLLLIAGEVHIWRAYLNPDHSTVRTFWKLLSADEQQRAKQYYSQRDREHFVVARGVLRKILSLYVNVSPGQIRFSSNSYGKPSLCHESGDQALRFNLTHSHGIALYAITRGCELGVDIEFMREDLARLEVAEQFFSPAEVSMLRACPHDSRTAAFFACWTRKEAYIKARGEGLSYPLHRFTVSLIPEEPASLLSTYDNPQEASRWALVELFPEQDYRAALAVEGDCPILHYWQWRNT